MYIRQVLKVKHDWWMYILGVVGAIAGVGLFSVPHLAGIFYKVFEGTADANKLEDINYLMTLFESNLNLAFMLLPFVGGLIFLIVMVKLLHKQSFTMLTTAREKIDWKRVWFAFILWGIISSGMVMADYFMNPEGYVLNFNLQPFLILCVLAIVLVPLQTSFEEYLFRGYLMQGLGVITKTKWFPLLFTSIVFGMLHIANPEVEKLGNIIMVYYIGTGLFLGIITLMDDGLELALGFHAANNLFTALLVTADWTAFQTHSIFKDMSDPTEAVLSDVLAPVLIIFPILLFIFAKVYKWNNWKEKLIGRVHDFPNEDYKIIGEPEED